MKKTVGKADAAVRIIIAAVIGIMYLAGYIVGAIALVLGIIAVLLLVTGITGYCPAYSIFGISTKTTVRENIKKSP